MTRCMQSRRAVLTSDSDPIEVWLVTNNEPAPKPEAESAERLQLPLPPQQPAAPILHASAAPAPAPLLSTPSPQAQASPFFKADPDGEGEKPLPLTRFLPCCQACHLGRSLMPCHSCEPANHSWRWQACSNPAKVPDGSGNAAFTEIACPMCREQGTRRPGFGYFPQPVWHWHVWLPEPSPEPLCLHEIAGMLSSSISTKTTLC